MTDGVIQHGNLVRMTLVRVLSTFASQVVESYIEVGGALDAMRHRRCYSM